MLGEKYIFQCIGRFYTLNATFCFQEHFVAI